MITLAFIGGAFAFIIVGLAWTGNLAKVSYLTKGVVSLFVDSKIKTVEGAKAVYNTAIEQAKDELREISEAVQFIAGDRKLLEQDIAKLKLDIPAKHEKCKQIMASASENRKEMAMPFAMQMEQLTIELTGKEQALPILKANEDEAIRTMRSIEDGLIKLQQERDMVIQGIQLNNTIAAANEKMINVRNKTPIKMLETVREGYKESKKRALGSEVVNNSLMSSKLEAATSAANMTNASAFLDTLDRKKALPSA